MKNIIAVLFLVVWSASAQTNKTNFFAVLNSDDGSVIMTNAEFHSVVGRKVIFKQTNSGALKSFDISTVSAATRDQLNINTAQAIESQKQIEEQNAKAAQYRAEQASELAERQKIETAKAIKRNEELKKQQAIDARKAKEEARREELHQLEVEAKRANIENTKASTRSINRSP